MHGLSANVGGIVACEPEVRRKINIARLRPCELGASGQATYRCIGPTLIADLVTDRKKLAQVGNVKRNPPANESLGFNHRGVCGRGSVIHDMVIPIERFPKRVVPIRWVFDESSDHNLSLFHGRHPNVTQATQNGQSPSRNRAEHCFTQSYSIAHHSDKASVDPRRLEGQVNFLPRTREPARHFLHGSLFADPS
jgi:hypothetical protein